VSEFCHICDAGGIVAIKADKTRGKLKKLQSAFAKARTLLIVMQDNPDPDAIGASMALKELAQKIANIKCQIAYGGTVGRAENRELVYYLGFKFHAFAEVDWRDFDLIALIDTQPGTGNNPLPADKRPDIVIDHHPIRKITRSISFTDIRQGYGATSTILWEYLWAAKIRPDVPLATALLYGIMSDTQDLGTETTKADIGAMEALYPLANKRMLSQIQRGRVPSSYFQMLASALGNTKLYGHCAICGVGNIDNADMIGEVADLLLRHEQVDWVLCYGFYNEMILISLRTQDKELSAGDVIRGMVEGIGTGGGHASMAGGQILLKQQGKSRLRRGKIEQLIRGRFLKALNIRKKEGAALVRM